MKGAAAFSTLQADSVKKDEIFSMCCRDGLWACVRRLYPIWCCQAAAPEPYHKVRAGSAEALPICIWVPPPTDQIHPDWMWLKKLVIPPGAHQPCPVLSAYDHFGMTRHPTPKRKPIPFIHKNFIIHIFLTYFFRPIFSLSFFFLF